MEWNTYNEYDLFTLWTENVEPVLYKLTRKGLDLDATSEDISIWWKTVGIKQKKCKHKEIIEALNYLNASSIRNNLKKVFANLKEKTEQLVTADSEAQKSQEKIEHLQSQLDKLLEDQVALAKRCEKYMDIIEDLKNKLIVQKLMPVRNTKANKHMTSESEKADDISLQKVPVSALKIMKHPNGTETNIQRALTVHECNSFKAEIGPFPLKGPFQPWWRRVVRHKYAFQLEPKDIWQIVFTSIPNVLIYKAPQVLFDGTIIQPIHPNESESEILNRLKLCLCDLRGKSPAEWELIYNRKQNIAESFETYAENLFELFEEYSGIDDVTRNNPILLGLLVEHAGPHVQKALMAGASPPKNTFEDIVNWGTKVESRRQMRSELAASGCHEDVKAIRQSSKIPCKKQDRFCCSCLKMGHTEQKCWSLNRGRPPPYFLRRRQSQSKDTEQHSRSSQNSTSSKTITELTNMAMQGLQLLASFASGLTAL